jgi:ketosteroid isomerase-like protein
MLSSVGHRLQEAVSTRTLALVVLAAGLWIVPARVESQSRPALSPDDLKQIDELTEGFAKGVLAKEFKAVSALYVENAVLYPPGETAVKGRTSIEVCLAALPPTTGFTMRTTSVEGRDDVAYSQGTYTMTIVDPREPKPIEASGYFVQISRKQTDGRWRIAVHMLNAH